MWTLLVICSVITAHGVQGVDRASRTPEAVTGTPDTRCGGYLYGSNGTFYSPNYPNTYPVNVDCTWYISPGRQIVQLELSNVNIESHPTCDFDTIYVYDGSSTGSRLLGKVCGKNTTTFYSTGAYLTVRFKSDSIVSYTGFRADFRVVGSCRYNCGYQVGDCSCYSSCGYRGNCCPDYQAFCQSSTVEPTSTVQLSCRYNCGNNLGSCSCSGSCQYYGNCCYDYNYYCPTTTWEPVPVTSESQPSCRYNCGRHMGSCSCTSSCQYYGNCCRDYNYYCASTTASTGITDRPSCRYNCGWHMGSCSCTSSCRYNGNCCHDYYSYCQSTTVRPATAQPSCRYNCGRHLGYCSCSSSCRYNGNCCYDYYSYCETTTTVRPTTAKPSCRYNCGNYLGSCSCSSSCRYNGNCCYDYYSYCSHSVTTDRPTTGGACGGSLFGSGTISSPNHPNHYYDNAYCVWQLRAPYDQRILLTFTYLQLENCCRCDYINIYDGPSVGSRFLGKVCDESNYNNQTTFYSTSNYMTVLFRTDGSVVGRGFSADFANSLPSSSGRVDCSSDNMNIVIERSYLNSLGYDGHSLYLDDPHCRPQVSRYQVVFSFPINTCGNVRKFENGRVVYTNTVRGYASSYGEITRQSHFKLAVGCRMEQDSVSQIMYLVKHHDNGTITGTGRFNTSMAFYTSSNFYYQVTQVPYEVTLNQNMYVQVDLRRGDSSLVLFLDTCVTSPSPHDFHTRPYYLVHNGCSRDSTYYAYVTGTRAYARFTFRAFKFLRATESVYIQCKVLICQASDYNSRCRRGCTRRMTRDVGSEHDSQTLVLGPIRLKGPEKKEEETQKKEKA
ncbi:deleted in malignant brain tumors 1 protein [Lates calcarifer]|uniref:Deleted in malignant brain tumors 1 protein n=1 Tax=Lates calcarifer TaxID=8187 RepID=A0AAJ7VG99_LATCA|nr:deleted in malignant brain tumors 1 protein [Lates calcarifer]